MILIKLMKTRIFNIYFLVFFIIFPSKGKQNNYLKNETNNEEKNIVYKDYIFQDNIKTLLCHQIDQEASLPIINIETNDKLHISFDDLDGEVKDYYYTIIHCNSDWTESKLIKSEYISGFFDNPITDFQLSFNTNQEYTHYYFNFPNNNIKPLLSGNYVFKIYREDRSIIAYKRFMILENKVKISANVNRGTLAKNRNEKHELDFSIEHPKINISDPFTEIKVIIKQNNNEETKITDLTPIYIKNNLLIYDYDNENNFVANNEFRYFEFSNLKYFSERVEKIIIGNKEELNQVYLFKDKKRSFDQYSIYPDNNGRFIINKQESWNSSIEADYAIVHFILPMEEVSYGDIYIIGAFSDWQLKDKFKLQFNYSKKQYERNVYLKQGFYNYCYALKDTIKNEIDLSYIEGTHYQTRNDYYIYVYYRGMEDRSDRLIGFLKTSSKELF